VRRPRPESETANYTSCEASLPLIGRPRPDEQRSLGAPSHMVAVEPVRDTMRSSNPFRKSLETKAKLAEEAEVAFNLITRESQPCSDRSRHGPFGVLMIFAAALLSVLLATRAVRAKGLTPEGRLAKGWKFSNTPKTILRPASPSAPPGTAATAKWRFTPFGTNRRYDQLTKLVEFAFVRTWSNTNSTAFVRPWKLLPTNDLVDLSSIRLAHKRLISLRRPRESQPASSFNLTENARCLCERCQHPCTARALQTVGPNCHFLSSA
jgi:hypothetical protein